MTYTTEALGPLRRLFFHQAAYHAEQFRKAKGGIGYSPACTARFTDSCRAHSYRCDVCVARELTPLTDDRLAQHLKGEVTLGAYQLREDGSAGWLCLDVDADEDTELAREHARLMTRLLLGRLHKMGLSPVCEYTGGRGYHIWVFIDGGAPAAFLRRLGDWLVSSVAEDEGAYAGIHVEVFPKQTALCPGEFGNLVKLPLGIHKKTEHRSIFVRDDLHPVSASLDEQLRYLESVRPIPAAELAQVIAEWVPDTRPQDGRQHELRARLRERARVPLPEILADHLTESEHRQSRPVPERDPVYLAAEYSRAAQALDSLAPWRADDYAAWIEIGMALSELRDAGLEMWDQWSSQSPKWEAGICAEKWPTFAPGDGITLATLCYRAQEDRDARAGDPSRLQVRSKQGATQIRVNNRQLPDVTREALAALVAANDPPRLFIRGGGLVRVEHDEHQRPVIRPLSLDALIGEMARSALFVKIDERGGRNVPPPPVVARDLAALPEQPFPPLLGIIEAPTLRPDGSVLDTPGYDATTRLYYHPAPGLTVPTVPAEPTRAELDHALGVLFDVLADFPFVDDASLAHAYALLLTPVLRPFIPGHTPILLVDKPQAGIGASLLTSIAAYVATGRPAALMTAPRDDDEWRKRLTAALLDGSTFILVDNVEGRLASASLAAVVTSPVWRDRILGRSETVELPVRATWTLTGNNVQLGGDLPRRAVWIRMDAQQARPWQRASFRHPQLLEYVAANRGTIVAAILTLARGWLAAGRPGPDRDCASLGSFESWRDIIGGILRLAGVRGFLANLERMYAQADSDGPAWVAFCEAWHRAFGNAPKTLREVAVALTPGKDKNLPDALEQLANALPSHLGEPGGRGFTRAFGKAMAQQADVHHEGGWVFRKAGAIKRAIRWRLERCDVTPKRLDMRGWAQPSGQGEFDESGEFSPALGRKSEHPNGMENDSPNSSNAPTDTDSGNGSTPPIAERVLRALATRPDGRADARALSLQLRQDLADTRAELERLVATGQVRRVTWDA